MRPTSNSFIQLGRTFHELARNARGNNDFDAERTVAVGARLQWDDLLRGHRTVILSEAGSGKTEEIRQTALRLRAEGNQAFFLRLEHVPENFEDAFEVGTSDEFEQWLASSEAGWLLLDSIDEARLRSPGDFELAIRKVGRRIQGARDRAHIILTGRASAWRAVTDLELCESHLPLTKTDKTAVFEVSLENLNEGAINHQVVQIENAENSDRPSGFRIVAIDNLSTAQIQAFAMARGVTDTKSFLEEIDRADAASFAARPQDLEELVGYWLTEQKIGSRLKVIRKSLGRRLEERDQSRSEARPLPPIRARDGARLLAAASTLGREQTIQVPDGSHDSHGIAVQTALPDWDQLDLQTLLSRPIFDQAIYGAVRFHHRSVREFLTAEWLAELLQRFASRREVESLFFRDQYGIEVVIPTMRPVLPWLAIFDERICDRVLRIAPEILFESGDPSALPLPTRKKVLADVCREIASGRTGRGVFDYGAAQRFASPELAEDIRSLLKSYSANSQVVTLLMRMVWLGRIASLKEETMTFAISPSKSRYARISAIQAMGAVATQEDIEELRTGFLHEAPELRRDWLGEIVEISLPSANTVSWLIEGVGKAAPKERYVTDNLTDAVSGFIGAAPIELLPDLASGLNRLLDLEPYIEHRICDVSAKHTWLTKPATIAVERLIRDRHEAALDEASLGILHKFRALRDWDDDLHELKSEFERLVPEWRELNRAALWYDVKRTRESDLYQKSAWRLTNFQQAAGLGSAHWSFGIGDFDYALDSVRAADSQDDKLVALTLAFDIFCQGDRPPPWRDALIDVSRGDAELEERLQHLLNPPVTEYDREHKKWQKRDSAIQRKEREKRAQSNEFIRSHVELIRAPKRDNPADISRPQWYLHQWLREKVEGSTRWTSGEWRDLIPEFGEDVAHAYREGAVNYWRKYQPKLQSEGATANSTPIPVIFGLAGLEIESAETPDWATSLSNDDVLLACRYASHELNGFPLWFPKLFEAHPEIVGEFLLNEIKWEIASEKPGEETHYLLSDLRWSGHWAWERLASPLLEVLKAASVQNLLNLEKLLAIVMAGANIADSELADLAKFKAHSAKGLEEAAICFAVWVGVDPEAGIPAAASYLASLAASSKQTQFAMTFVTTLVGERRSRSDVVRRRFMTGAHLKDLYLLIQKYVRTDDDIDRSGEGAYSPTLRDDAQDARNALFNFLRTIPGKEAFLALSEIAAQNPSRPWIAEYARGRAEEDADFTAWTASQVRDFHENLDRTPSNHGELADLAVSRLLDLKDDLENGDESVARILQGVDRETVMRNYLAHVLRNKAAGRYTITQEEQFADDKHPDLRFHGAGFDSPVPAELKMANNWTGPKLFERLENQLAGGYLRDIRSARGIFVLVNREKNSRWRLSSGNTVEFDDFVAALQAYWESIAARFPGIDDITVVGIDLSKRFEQVGGDQ